MVEDAMALYKLENLWPVVDETLLKQMKAEEQILAENDGIAEWTLWFATCLQMNGEDFSVGNRRLVDFVLRGDFRLLELSLVRMISRSHIKDVMGVNPVVQDKLSDNTQVFEDAMSEMGSDEEAEEARDEMMNLLLDIHDHEEIGKRLGLGKEALGVYDSLRGLLFEGFSPRVVDMAKELWDWLDERVKIPGGMTRDAVETKIEKLEQKYELMVPVSTMAVDYIMFDIIPNMLAE